MGTYQVTLTVPEKVLLAEKTDVDSFGREVLLLAAVKLYELGPCPPAVLLNWPE